MQVIEPMLALILTEASLLKGVSQTDLAERTEDVQTMLTELEQALHHTPAA